MVNEHDVAYRPYLRKIDGLLGSTPLDHEAILRTARTIIDDIGISMNLRATVCKIMGDAYMARGEHNRGILNLTEAHGLAMILEDFDAELVLDTSRSFALAKVLMGNPAGARIIVNRVRSSFISEIVRGNLSPDSDERILNLHKTVEDFIAQHEIKPQEGN